MSVRQQFVRSLEIEHIWIIIHSFHNSVKRCTFLLMTALTNISVLLTYYTWSGGHIKKLTIT